MSHSDLDIERQNEERQTTMTETTMFERHTDYLENFTYTTEALQLQLDCARDWFTAHAFDPHWNYSDQERKEMANEITELQAQVSARKETPR